MRWIWVDRFLDFQPRRSARAVKNTTVAEDHFAQHFPGYPIMPASLMLEGLAQTGGILVGQANAFAEKVVLAKIPRAYFHREVRAGEELIYDVEVIDLRDEGASVRGKVTSAGELVGEAEIMFIHLDKSRAGAVFGQDNFVFTGELMKVVGLQQLLDTKDPGAATA
jgi:3-hydroxyacyl-[acyl-carrier-protein] dehydratase